MGRQGLNRAGSPLRERGDVRAGGIRRGRWVVAFWLPMAPSEAFMRRGFGVVGFDGFEVPGPLSLSLIPYGF